MADRNYSKNFVGLVQEFAQKNKLPAPLYSDRIICYDPNEVEYTCSMEGLGSASGRGQNKKQAKTLAASAFYNTVLLPLKDNGGKVPVAKPKPTMTLAMAQDSEEIWALGVREALDVANVTIVCCSKESPEQAHADCLNWLNTYVRPLERMVVGCDLEWTHSDCPAFLIQLSTLHSVLIVQLTPPYKVPIPLRNFFQDPNSTKVFWDMQQDLRYLWHHLNILPQGFDDACTYANLLLEDPTKPSLVAAFQTFFRKYFPKDKKISVSDWSRWPLTPGQLEYAARDPLATLLIWRECRRIMAFPPASSRTPLPQLILPEHLQCHIDSLPDHSNDEARLTESERRRMEVQMAQEAKNSASYGW